MGPVRLLVPILRALGYTAFLAWCLVVGLAVSAASLAGIGRLAGRASTPS
ncbi:MAG TPA: hypothetical protein VFT84_04630 [Gemmatimonadales bacterium]|nr:hypothetical protein [Gemmatimonadales bacterium]